VTPVKGLALTEVTPVKGLAFSAALA